MIERNNSWIRNTVITQLYSTNTETLYIELLLCSAVLFINLCAFVMGPLVWCGWRWSSDSLSSCTGSNAPDVQGDRKCLMPTSGRRHEPNAPPAPPLARPQPPASRLLPGTENGTESGHDPGDTVATTWKNVSLSQSSES